MCIFLYYSLLEPNQCDNNKTIKRKRKKTNRRKETKMRTRPKCFFLLRLRHHRRLRPFLSILILSVVSLLHLSLSLPNGLRAAAGGHWTAAWSAATTAASEPPAAYERAAGGVNDVHAGDPPRFAACGSEWDCGIRGRLRRRTVPPAGLLASAQAPGPREARCGRICHGREGRVCEPVRKSF